VPESLQKKSLNKAWVRNLLRIFVIALILTVGIFYLSIKPPSPDWVGMGKSEEEFQKIDEVVNGKSTKTITIKKIEQSKTLWDWLSLLGVPITLAILGYLLQQIQQKRAEDLVDEQRRRDQNIAEMELERTANETKEEALQVYFDRLSILLVDKNLRMIAAKINSQESEESQATPEEKELLDSAVDVIRARTLSILRRFENDTERKTSVIRFLIEADFISKLKLNLSSANLSGAILNGADLSGANLSRANLSRANLSRANLSGANLSGANLSGAILIGADLSYANLNGAYLRSAHLRSADLSSADLSSADLVNAHLSNSIIFSVNPNDAYLLDAYFNDPDLNGADFSRGADLSDADLSDADLSDADLSDADLSGADLSGATNFLSKQIKSAKIWESALYDDKRLDDPEVSKQLGLDSKP
jgi:uncharacterized protein YjbI with pentapeptide repeats